MDHQPLNTGEQKDMTEFFTDLISKMEDMGQELVCRIKLKLIKLFVVDAQASDFFVCGTKSYTKQLGKYYRARRAKQLFVFFFNG